MSHAHKSDKIIISHFTVRFLTRKKIAGWIKYFTFGFLLNKPHAWLIEKNRPFFWGGGVYYAPPPVYPSCIVTRKVTITTTIVRFWRFTISLTEFRKNCKTSSLKPAVVVVIYTFRVTMQLRYTEGGRHSIRPPPKKRPIFFNQSSILFIK